VTAEYPPAWDREPFIDIAAEEHACPECGRLFIFAGVRPDPDWLCGHCKENPDGPR
jgi:ribosomal protein L37AE/L43A